MRLLNDAINDCLALAPPRRTMVKPLIECLNHSLSASVYAHSPLPRWPQSAMDGYAVRSAEARQGAMLTLGEVIPAGHWPKRDLQRGECARIFTGAPLPREADAVLLQENATLLVEEGRVRVEQSARLSEHIRQTGEEVVSGQQIAAAEESVTPGLLGLCSAQGFTHLEVFEKPKLSILETGSELVPLGAQLSGAEIYATNAITLSPMIEGCGGQLISVTRVSDDPKAVVSKIQEQIQLGTQLIITTGGVSVGDFDPIHEALSQLGAERTFWKVKMKPGKPVSVATLETPQGGRTLIIGLPGNPVSCVVGYLLFVHPLIEHLSGRPKDQIGLRRLTCQLDQEITKSHHRSELFRVRIHPGSPPLCRLTGGQSSAWISSISSGDGLLYTPPEPCELKSGELVEIALFPWFDPIPKRLLYSV